MSGNTTRVPKAGSVRLGLALAAALVGAVPAQAGTSIVDVGHNDGTMAIGAPQQRRVVRDADGYWYAVWVQKNGTKWEVRLSRSNDRKGASWAAAVTLAGASAIINNDSAANHYLNAGASLVSYVGHGSSGLWATEGLLRSPDVAALAPQPRQPLVLTMTCSNGYD